MISTTVTITSRMVMLHAADGTVDQLGAVVDRYDLYACRQAWLNLLELGLDAVDHVERILAAAHDHDAGDHLSLCRSGRRRRGAGRVPATPRRRP